MTPIFEIVLVEPEIPWNTGNVARTCIGLGARLHLVEPLGFSLEDKDMKRAGLDYWDKLVWKRHPSLEAFLENLPEGASVFCLSTKGKKTLWELRSQPGSYFLFGAETRGLPTWLLERYADRVYRIPMTGDIRSLNLSTAVGIAAYEAARQLNAIPLPGQP
jgi:tRNA (cytidine/uridine-2'-O-)-methyltransferase